MKTNNYIYYMNRLPIEVKRHIYDFDPLKKEIHQKLIAELERKIMWYWYSQNTMKESLVSNPVIADEYYRDELIFWENRTFSKWFFEKYSLPRKLFY